MTSAHLSGWATAPDGVRLWVEVTGTGTPVLFLHEFAGDSTSWEPQLASLSGRYQCITYNARGYPPSDVPREGDSYSQEHAVTDALAVLDWAGLPAAHMVGLSMGGFSGLHLAMDHGPRCLSVTAAGVGYGAAPGDRDGFAVEAHAAAGAFESDPQGAAARYAQGPTRVQYRAKDPRGHRRFAEQLAAHHPVGSANTLRGVQARRPSLFDLKDRLRGISVPLLLLVGDEDEGCLETNIMIKRAVPMSALMVLPRTGHTVNLEEPAAFNSMLDTFLSRVALGHWPERDASSQDRGLVGM